MEKNRLRDSLTAVDKLLEHADETAKQAHDLLLILVEVLARDILAKHPNLDEFIMGRGSWLFTRKTGSMCRGYKVTGGISEDIHSDNYPAYMKTLVELIAKHDQRLCLTGVGMRFTAKGEVRRSW